MEILDRSRVQASKRGFATRRVPEDAIKTLLCGDRTPRVGDLVLARVQTLGSHQRIELPSGRRAYLFPGDEIVLAYGNRYAPDQFEAYVPNSLERCHMVAAGGIAAVETSRHGKMAAATEIEPIGLIGHVDGAPVNVADFALKPADSPLPANVFAVFGTSMNAGKTTTAASIVKGFAKAGCTVGAAKVTGTGAGGDLWLMKDSGAAEAVDFTDAGFPTTFEVDTDALVEGSQTLVRTLSQRGCSVIVLEVADGLYQRETAGLARSDAFRSMLSGTFFAAGDAMGAVAGADHLAFAGHRVLGISGALTRSPLAIREATAAAEAPVYLIDDLIDPQTVTGWLDGGSVDLARAAGE